MSLGWKELQGAISKGDFAPVYLFSGPETFVKQEMLSRLGEKLLNPAFEQLNRTVLDGSSAQEVIAAAATLPFMDEKRLVVVKDFPLLLSGRAKNEDEQFELLSQYVQNPCESTVLIFYMRENADGKKKLTALLKKQAQSVEFAALDDADLYGWIDRRFAVCKKRIDRPAAIQLAERCGRELINLVAEIAKLCAYRMDQSQITLKDVEALVPANVEYGVFDMLNALTARNQARARECLSFMVDAGQSITMILSMVTRQYRLLSNMKLMQAAGQSLAQAQTALGVKPYEAKRLWAQLPKLSTAGYKELFAACVDAEFSLKSGRMRDTDALECVINFILAKFSAK